jgi:hypothetical protein
MMTLFAFAGFALIAVRHRKKPDRAGVPARRKIAQPSL